MLELLKKFWFVTPEEATKSADAIYTAVKPDQRRSTVSLWILAIAYGYTITGFIVGETLLTAESSVQYWLSMIVGYAVLALVGFIVAIPAYMTGCNTTIFMKYTYGQKGYIVPSIVMILLITLHIGFQTSTFGEVLFPMGSPQFVLTCCAAGILMILATIKGIKGLETVANIAIAFLILAVVICLFRGLMDVGGILNFNNYINGLDHSNAPSTTFLMNVVIGSWTLGACTNGQLTRFCKTKKSMFGFVFLAFFLVQIALAVVGSLSVIIMKSYIFVEYARKLNAIFGVFCTIAFLLALFTTILTNIYLIQIPIASIANGSIRAVGVVWGILIAILGAVGFSRFATPVLNFSGIILPPFMGPLILDYYLNKDKYFYKPEVLDKKLPKWNWWSFISAIAGLLISYVWIPPFMPTAIWSILLSAIIYLILFEIIKLSGKRIGIGTIKIDEELDAARILPYHPEQLKNIHE